MSKKSEQRVKDNEKIAEDNIQQPQPESLGKQDLISPVNVTYRRLGKAANN